MLNGLSANGAAGWCRRRAISRHRAQSSRRDDRGWDSCCRWNRWVRSNPGPGPWRSVTTSAGSKLNPGWTRALPTSSSMATSLSAR